MSKLAIPKLLYMKKWPRLAPIFPNKLVTVIDVLVSNFVDSSCTKSKSCFQLNTKETKAKKRTIETQIIIKPKTT
mgnify:CR=1 FL=1